MEHNLLDIFRAKCKNLVSISPQKVIHDFLSNYEVNKQSELTITFRDDWLRDFSVSFIQRALYKFMQKQSKKYGFEYMLVQDYSKNYRLHYHGIIWLTNIEDSQRIRLSLQRKFGRTELRCINESIGYQTYIFGLYIPEHEKYNPNIDCNLDRIIASSIINVQINKIYFP